MLKTVSSNKSLILWDHNANESNIDPADPLFLKNAFINVFRKIENLLHSNNFYASFVTLWNQVLNEQIPLVKAQLKTHSNSEEAIELVLNKFRGNCGEIFAEKFFTNGFGADVCSASNYIPVDPDNERYIDASSTSSNDGLPIGIQVKAYNDYNIVKDVVFAKAAAMNWRWEHEEQIIPESDWKAFGEHPHQFIFATAETWQCIKDDWLHSVHLLGKTYIDSKKLQGSMKTNQQGNWLFFKEIADEIEKLQFTF